MTSEPYDDSGNPYEPPPLDEAESVKPDHLPDFTGGFVSLVCGTVTLILTMFLWGTRSEITEAYFILITLFSFSGLVAGFLALKSKGHMFAIMGIVFSAMLPVSLLLAFLIRFF